MAALLGYGRLLKRQCHSAQIAFGFHQNQRTGVHHHGRRAFTGHVYGHGLCRNRGPHGCNALSVRIDPLQARALCNGQQCIGRQRVGLYRRHALGRGGCRGCVRLWRNTRSSHFLRGHGLCTAGCRHGGLGAGQRRCCVRGRGVVHWWCDYLCWLTQIGTFGARTTLAATTFTGTSLARLT